MAEVSVLKDVECEACEVIVKLLKPLIDRNATEVCIFYTFLVHRVYNAQSSRSF